MDQATFRAILWRTIATPLLLVVTLAGLALWTASELNSAMEAVDSADRTLSQSQHVLKLLIDMETGVRGYLLTGSDEFLQPYRQAELQFEPAYLELDKGIATDHTQHGRLEGLHSRFVAWHSYAKTMILLRQEHQGYADVATNLSGKAEMDSMRAQVLELEQAEEELRASRSLVAHRLWHRAVLSWILLGVGLGTGLAFFLRRRMQILAAMFQNNLESVEKNEQRWRTTLTSIADAVITADIDRRVTYLNPAAVALTGWNPEDATGQPIEHIFHAIHERTRKPLAVFEDHSGADESGQTSLLRRDGRELLVEEQVTPLRDDIGRVEGAVLVFRQISLERRAQQVKESEERFQALLLASSDVVYRMSPDWREMRQLSGRAFIADTVVSNFQWLTEYIHPEDQPLVWAAIEEAVGTKSMFKLEHRVIRINGALGWTYSRAIPLINSNGEIVEWLGVATDITERKETEAALLRSEKLAAVGRMAASIAHEINNPLAAVINTLYLARLSAAASPAVLLYLGMADDELSRIAHVTRQTLGFYHESSKPEIVCVNTVLAASLDTLRAKIKAKDAQIVDDTQGEHYVRVVSGELRQVLSNLLANGLEAIHAGGRIRLRVSSSTCVNTGVNRVRITIADNGVGIDRLTLPRIFEPLFTTKTATGAGLGLWVSRQIVEKHMGQIRVFSWRRSGASGSVLSVLLPAQTVVRDQLTTPSMNDVDGELVLRLHAPESAGTRQHEQS